MKLRCATFGSLVLLGVTVFATCPALGQSPGDCKAVLQKTDVNRVHTFSQKLAFLRVIDTREQWENAKKINGGLTAIFDDLPISAETNYSDFESYRSSKLSQVSLSYNQDEAEALVTSFLPSDAIAAWSKCVTKSANLTAYFEDVTSDHLTLFIKWVSPYEQGVKLPAPTWSGGYPQGSVGLPRLVHGTWSKSIIFRRNKDQDFRFALALGSDNADLFVPSEKVHPPTKQCVEKMDNFVHVQPDADDPNNGNMNYYCVGMTPGAPVDALVKGNFKIDGGGAWTEMQAVLNGTGPTTGRVEHCEPNGKSGIYCYGTDTTASFPLTITSHSTVPGNGTVQLTVHVFRAETTPGGQQKTLSAESGATVTITTPPQP